MQFKRHNRSISILLSAWLVLYGYCVTFAQHARMDSLKYLLEQEINESSKVDLLLKLSFGHYQIDVSKCKAYGLNALQISERLNDTVRIAQAYNCLGIAADLQGNSNLAIDYWEKSLSLSKEMEFLNGEMKSLNNLGLAHKEKGNIEKSLQYFLAALKIDEITGNEKQSVNTLSNVGYLYLSMNDLGHAFHYLQKAIKKGEKLNSPSSLSHPYQRMGEYYVLKKEYESALPFLNRAYDICKEYDQDLRITTTLRLIGECQYYLGNEKDAVASFYEAENLLLKIGEKYTELFTLYETWAIVNSELGDYEKAFNKADQGYDLATSNNLEASKLSSLQLLGKLHEKGGNYKKALDYYNAASDQEDRMHLRSKEELLLELETKYQSDKKDVENDLLRAEQENVQTKLKTKNVLVAAIGLVLLLVGIVAFLLLKANRQKQRYNEVLRNQVAERTQELESSNVKLRESNKQLERFAFIASHDLKTPLRNIVSFTGLLERSLDMKNEKVQEYLTFLKEGGKRMNFLIEDLLAYSKLSSSSEKEITEVIDLNLLCKEINNTIFSTLKVRNAKMDLEKSLPTINGNYSSFFLLFKNLIENAVKYNESVNPTVRLDYKVNEHTFSISFVDNGIGIDEKHFKEIWEMFARLHTQSKYEGTGLGLATCKKIVDNLDGSIDVSSEVCEGSTFTLTLPKDYLVTIPVDDHDSANTPIAVLSNSSHN